MLETGDFENQLLGLKISKNKQTACLFNLP